MIPHVSRHVLSSWENGFQKHNRQWKKLFASNRARSHISVSYLQDRHVQCSLLNTDKNSSSSTKKHVFCIPYCSHVHYCEQYSNNSIWRQSHHANAEPLMLMLTLSLFTNEDIKILDVFYLWFHLFSLEGWDSCMITSNFRSTFLLALWSTFNL